MKYLITGFSGFVSKHFLSFLEQQGIAASILGIDVQTPDFSTQHYKHIQCCYKKIDMLHKDDLEKAICQFQPDYVLHLASYSSVAYSWKNPVISFANNTSIFLNLLETIRMNNIQCRVLSVGSSEEYGRVDIKALPLKESDGVKPISPYAVARVSQEMLSKVYVEGFNMDIVMTRSFNHIGPGQSDGFVVSSFVRQALEVLKGEREHILCGDLSIIRDFIDVRDVVRAYQHLLDRGSSGEVYNVCSGRGLALSDILNKICDKVEIGACWQLMEDLIRPIDNPVIIGNGEKIQKVGFMFFYDLERSLEDMIQSWREKER